MKKRVASFLFDSDPTDYDGDIKLSIIFALWQLTLVVAVLGICEMLR